MTTLFLCGDVMTGRGVDQILPLPSDPVLREPFIDDARDYVALAEARSGPVPRGVSPAYVWGDALAELARVAPDARLINLETSVTTSDDFWPDKGIHYRMNPANVSCLVELAPDVCVLANNHVLDFGRRGLAETLEVLAAAGLRTVGAGRDLEEARAPVRLARRDGGGILVFALAEPQSGVPPEWAAEPGRPGVNFLPEVSDEHAAMLLEEIARARRPGDLVVVSLHWGTNWGYEVPAAHVRFAHVLIDGGVDVIFGHSSHHPRPIEIYRDRLVLYGCGDFLNDYEGITGYETYRDDLVLMYFPTLDAETGALLGLAMTPLEIHRMRLRRARLADARWLASTLERASRRFGTVVSLAPDGTLRAAPLRTRSRD